MYYQDWHRTKKPRTAVEGGLLPAVSAVVSATADATTLDAMKLMNDEGVSSIAVVEEVSGTLLSAISVTDIGRVGWLYTDIEF